MSHNPTDCDICFSSQNCFKKLQCGHNFCHNCCVDIVESSEETPLRFTISCPNCRKITDVSDGGVDKLKNRFVGSLKCYHCDSEKSILDFRFCLICFRSVCSTCFLDSHHNSDGTFHKAAKWETLVGVKKVVEQLQKISENSRNDTEKCKQDVEVYLDGLKQHLWDKIEAFGNSDHSALSFEADSLIDSFGLDRRSLQPAKHMSDDLFRYLLTDVKRVAVLSENEVKQKGTELQSYPYEVFEPIFLSKTPQPIIPCWFDPTKLQSRFVQTKLVASELIKTPWDVVVSEGRVVIVDKKLGPHIRINSTFMPITLQHKFSEYGRIYKVPETAIIMVTALALEKTAAYFLLVWDNIKSEYHQLKFPKDRFHMSLPVGVRNVFASTSNIYCLTGTALFQFDLVGKMSFKQIYSVDDSWSYEGIGDVDENGKTTDFYLINKLWKSIDVLKLKDDCVTQIHRVNLALLSPSLDSLVDPVIRRYFVNGYYLLWDLESTALHLWNVKANSCAKVVDFCLKKPRWVRIFDQKMFLFTAEGDQSCVEEIDLSDFLL